MSTPNYFGYHAKEGSLGVKPTFIGREAKHKYGVEYNCRWLNEDGFSTHGRRVALAMNAAGVPVKMAGPPVFVDDLEPKMRAEMEPLISMEVGTVVAKVTHALPNDGVAEQILARYLSDSRGALTMEQAEAMNGRRILSTVFEQVRITIRKARTLSRFGAVWVATEKDRRMLLEAGVPEEKVAVIRIPYDPSDGLLALRGRERLAGPLRFYHIGKWEPRKDQHTMIGAFLCAFKPRDHVTFYLKTSERAPDFGSDLSRYYPSNPAESMAIWLNYDRVKDNGWTMDMVKQRLFLIRGQRDRANLLSLHRSGDVYVSLSHGEGYDMPSFEAKLAGNAMVYTESGGPQEFASSTDFKVIAAGEEEPHPFYRWGQGATWIRYDIDVAAEAMRRAAFGAELTRSGGDSRVHEFSPEQVGSEARRSVERLLARCDASCEW